MTINLSKGGNISLDKVAPDLKNILVGLGWDQRTTDGHAFDLDASVFMVDQNGSAISPEHFVFYNNLKSPCGSVEHTGDNLTGEGDGDDESIKVFLDKVPQNVERIVFTVTIHLADERKQNFGQVQDAFIRLVNIDNNAELARFDLNEDYSTETALIFAELYRHQGQWKFKAVGQGYAGGLAALVKAFNL